MTSSCGRRMEWFLGEGGVGVVDFPASMMMYPGVLDRTIAADRHILFLSALLGWALHSRCVSIRNLPG
jgi:hypothetical protein